MAYSQAHRLPLPSDAPSSSSTVIDHASLSFVVDQAKLNPVFEAYKLVQDASASARSYGLPSRPPRLTELYQPPQGHQDGKLTFTGLGFKETKERALHQVLVPSRGQRSEEEPFAAYIDANRFVVVLTYDSIKDKVVGHPVHRLLQQQGATSLPSLASLSATEWLASSGGSFMLIKLQRVMLGDGGVVRWTSGTEVRWRMPSEGTIKACSEAGGRIRVLLQSTKTISTSNERKAKEGMQGLGFQPNAQQVADGSKKGQPARSTTVFEVQLVEIDDSDTAPATGPDEHEGEGASREVKLLWTVQGEEPLITAKLDEHETLLGAEAPLTSLKRARVRADTATQPTAAATSPNVVTSPPSAASSRGRRRAPHFSWAQTGDTITIAFALPPWITKSHVRAHFSLGALSLSFTQEASTLLNAPASSAKITEIDHETANAATAGEDDDLMHAARMIASGRYVSRSTWAEIDPTGSVWTLERSRGLSLLTLHLEKKHEGTRWMQVFANRTGTGHRSRNRNYAEVESTTQLSFAQARSTFERAVTGESSSNGQEKTSDREEDDDAEDNEDDVPETMDPSELISMLEGMQKYTVDEESVGTGDGFGMDRTGLSTSAGHAQNSGGTSLSLDQPSLLKESLEEEDANVGRAFVVSSIDHAASNKSVSVRSSKEGETTILATALPGDSTENEAVVIKHDLDGAIFTTSAASWDHVATMPALSFVLASKRDAQRVHIHKHYNSADQPAEYVVLAFESAPRVTGSGSTASNIETAGNLFLYYSPSSSSAKTAASRVIRLGATDQVEEEEGEESASGALLGVCSVGLPGIARDGDGEKKLEDTLVCLCENRILLLRGVL
ncbi:hypothetical protein EX895_000802 [Sporisorium graminicola]|uniref:NudC domain-containing protein 1 n=1 Tax=Sporisorium graminicola TaxID=280036 RepID=A0A4U7L0Q7_9BASI|nr:hypothetical protein EX895_000802 [Sporisorium graminicola]TKY90804.1 hypothetical protein EX895_000802 [Sporisorium graminicola]